MGTEGIGGECLEVDMIASHELGNRSQGDFTPEDVGTFLDKGFRLELDYDGQNERELDYYVTTYINGKEKKISVLKSHIDESSAKYGKENAIYIEILYSFKGKISDGIDSGLFDYFLSEGEHSKLLNNGREEARRILETDIFSYLSIILVNKGIIDGNLRKLEPEEQKKLYEKYYNGDLSQFESLGIEEYVEGLVNGGDFEERREEYLVKKRENGGQDICNYSQVELTDLKQEILLTEIDDSEAEGDLGKLVKLIKAEGFKENKKENNFVSSDRSIVISFPSDSVNEFIGAVTVLKSPSGPYNTDIKSFIKRYNTNRYT